MQGSYAQVSGWAVSAGTDVTENVLARFATGRNALRLACGIAVTLGVAIRCAVPSLPGPRVAAVAGAREAAVRVGARSIGVAGVRACCALVVVSAVPSLPGPRVAAVAGTREAAVRVGARSIGVAGVRACCALVNVITPSIAEIAAVRAARSNCGARVASGAAAVRRLERVFSDGDRHYPVARGIHEVVADRVRRRLDA